VVQLGELVNCVGRKVIWFDVPAEVNGDPDQLEQSRHAARWDSNRRRWVTVPGAVGGEGIVAL